MSQFSDYAAALLSGGLPAVLDYGRVAAPSATGDTRPERTRPTGTAVDEEPFLGRFKQGLTAANLAIGLLGVGVVAGLLFVVIRAAR